MQDSSAMTDEAPPYNPRPFLLTSFTAAALVLIGFGVVAASQLKPMPHRAPLPAPEVRVVVVPVPTPALAATPTHTAPPVVVAKRPHREPARPATTRPAIKLDCLHSNDPACGIID
jgi:hypothetical protein